MKVDSSTAVRVAADNRRGILWMLLTVFLFVSMDTLAKHLMQTYSVGQVVWARYLFHTLFLVALLNLQIPGLLRTRRVGLQLVRSVLLVATTALFFAGISLIPLADASAVMLVGPLLVTALSVPFLGEAVGPRRWAGVLIGFVGALVIIRPGAAVFEPAALLPLAAASIYAVYQILTRKLSHTDGPLTTLLYTALAGVVLTSLVVPFFWQTPSPVDWAVMVVVGGLGALSQFCIIKAFQAAPASVVTPFTYSNMIWATLYGFLVFGDLPDGFTLFGAAILIASGLYVFHRERVRKVDPGS